MPPRNTQPRTKTFTTKIHNPYIDGSDDVRLESCRSAFALPDELWVIIFDILGDPGLVHYALPYERPALSADHHAVLSDRRAAASKRARNLLLVSRRWRNIATPIFWKVVSLHELSRPRCTEKLHALGAALKAEEQPGRLVRELILNLSYAPIEKVAWIVAKCPQLKSLIIETETYWSGDSIARYLRLPDTLQNLRYQKLYAPRRPFPQQLVSLVNSAPNLTAFSLTSRDHSAIPETCKLSNVVALQLYQMPVEDGVAATFEWKLPRMTHLSILGLVRPQEMAFMSRFGPQLIFLELPPWVEELVGSSLGRVLTIITSMPNLRELVIPTSSVMGWITGEMKMDPSSYRHPTITHLGFKGFAVYGEMCEILRFAQDLQWPALQCVRLMEDPPREGRRMYAGKVAKLRARLSDGRIVVEDKFGRNVSEDS